MYPNTKGRVFSCSPIGFAPNPIAKYPTSIFSRLCFLCRRPAAPFRSDPRCPRPAVHASFVPQHRSTFLLRAIFRVLFLRYPAMPADVADGYTHSRPCHAAIIQHSAPGTEYAWRGGRKVLQSVLGTEYSRFRIAAAILRNTTERLPMLQSGAFFPGKCARPHFQTPPRPIDNVFHSCYIPSMEWDIEFTDEFERW